MNTKLPNARMMDRAVEIQDSPVAKSFIYGLAGGVFTTSAAHSVTQVSLLTSTALALGALACVLRSVTVRLDGIGPRQLGRNFDLTTGAVLLGMAGSGLTTGASSFGESTTVALVVLPLILKGGKGSDPAND